MVPPAGAMALVGMLTHRRHDVWALLLVQRAASAAEQPGRLSGEASDREKPSASEAFAETNKLRRSCSLGGTGRVRKKEAE